MINQLLKLYPQAVLADQPNHDPHLYWFKENNTNDFIGIPKSILSEKERKLLQALFPSMSNLEAPFSKTTQDWNAFLRANGPIPSLKKDSCRLIHFSISNIRDTFHFDEFEEALKSLFPNEIIIVPFNIHEGVIIEEQTDIQMDEEELISTIQAFESDFFFKVHFYIGRFYPVIQKLRDFFQLEQSMFTLSLQEQPEEQMITIEKVVPLYTYKAISNHEKHLLFATIRNVLAEEPELSATIKQYIENHSNATLTAKQLFMHRNSLQYRIDKFIEKTGIDIKTFHGAFFAYLACLHEEQE
ncbi:helix-turn-helix domain-containing protein [Bacillus sp. FJAT-50079]|uniref:PucR family transcriptional regulator n=1 Tax=Bacillus sp. FJAT-50079 TaxID=2833577 RepID=UPI001BC9A579|nr:helix-turn-helix domain-containing protein [Bacillus sp. FJAT-50079]MBS4210715.1 helix-turn-helix domain-containing protein [Bacillus sp. FJAT-50079]